MSYLSRVQVCDFPERTDSASADVAQLYRRDDWNTISRYLRRIRRRLIRGSSVITSCVAVRPRALSGEALLDQARLIPIGAVPAERPM